MRHTTRCHEFGCGRFAPPPVHIGFVSKGRDRKKLLAMRLCSICQRKEDRRATRAAVLMANLARAYG